MTQPFSTSKLVSTAPKGVLVTELSPAEEAKMLAEADQARALAAKYEQERLRALAETRLAEAAAAQAEIGLARDTHKHKLELAADEHHLFYPFVGEVSSKSVDACMDQLTIWMRTRPGEPIEIQFNSPGGSVVDGLALWDFIQTLKVKGHHITTSAIGYAASMAGILLQAGDARVIGRESWLMIHETSFGVYGKFGEVADRTDWIKRVQLRILDIFASRSTLSAEEIGDLWERKDWWLDSTECLELGFVDQIR